jgi:hypothetical protein
VWGEAAEGFGLELKAAVIGDPVAIRLDDFAGIDGG